MQQTALVLPQLVNQTSAVRSGRTRHMQVFLLIAEPGSITYGDNMKHSMEFTVVSVTVTPGAAPQMLPAQGQFMPRLHALKKHSSMLSEIGGKCLIRIHTKKMRSPLSSALFQ